MTFLEMQLHGIATDYFYRVDAGIQQTGRLMRAVTAQDVSEAIVENSVSVTTSWLGTPIPFEWTGLTVDADRRIFGTFPVDGDNTRNIIHWQLGPNDQLRYMSLPREYNPPGPEMGRYPSQDQSFRGTRRQQFPESDHRLLTDSRNRKKKTLFPKFTLTTFGIQGIFRPFRQIHGHFLPPSLFLITRAFGEVARAVSHWFSGRRASQLCAK